MLSLPRVQVQYLARELRPHIPQAVWCRQNKKKNNEDRVKRDDLCTHTHTHTNTMEYYSAVKKNEVTPLAATRMNLEIAILSEVSQRKKNNI